MIHRICTCLVVLEGCQALWDSPEDVPCREDALSMGETDLTQTGELMRFTISANMAGIPAISVPVGYCPKGASSSIPLTFPCFREVQRACHV